MKPNESVLDLPSVSDAARAQLREVRFAGGRLKIDDSPTAQDLARQLRKAGYIHIDESGFNLRLTGNGQAYLDRLMRAH